MKTFTNELQKSFLINISGKIFLPALFIFALLFTQGMKAQVSTYSFNQQVMTYTPITGGTLIGLGTNDDNSYGQYAIGFNFVFNGVTYSTWGLQNNGWMSFGSLPS